MFVWDVFGQECFVVGFDCFVYCVGYQYWVVCVGNGGVYQYVVVVQFYCDCCVGGGVYVGIDNDWYFGIFDDFQQVVFVLDVQF